MCMQLNAVSILYGDDQCGMMEPTSATGSSKPYRPRRYYCSDPVNPDCRKGFITTTGLTRHRDAVHKHQKPVCRPQQYQPKSKSGSTEGVGAKEDEVQESYYIKHPVLDGRWIYFLDSFIDLAFNGRHTS